MQREEIIVLSDSNDDREWFLPNNAHESQESIGREWFDPYDRAPDSEDENMTTSSQTTERSEREESPRVLFEGRLDRYIRRRWNYTQYIAQIGVTWTLIESDSEGGGPALVESAYIKQNFWR
ncbi:hypothetical protein EVAR_73518_1 [Eumeta japonica]|uniref:Uncharacterized protein n=1 Tax=Eumeta variegata TaxID=151549 RepID=A0A4C1SQ58_EUMVA|nr:hypothetical protein EVAR_73518_1 [Eumeta japonica]